MARTAEENMQHSSGATTVAKSSLKDSTRVSPTTSNINEASSLSKSNPKQAKNNARKRQKATNAPQQDSNSANSDPETVRDHRFLNRSLDEDNEDEEGNMLESHPSCLRCKNDIKIYKQKSNLFPHVPFKKSKFASRCRTCHQQRFDFENANNEGKNLRCLSCHQKMPRYMIASDFDKLDRDYRQKSRSNATKSTSIFSETGNRNSDHNRGHKYSALKMRAANDDSHDRKLIGKGSQNLSKTRFERSSSVSRSSFSSEFDEGVEETDSIDIDHDQDRDHVNGSNLSNEDNDDMNDNDDTNEEVNKAKKTISKRICNDNSDTSLNEENSDNFAQNVENSVAANYSRPQSGSCSEFHNEVAVKCKDI